MLGSFYAGVVKRNDVPDSLVYGQLQLEIQSLLPRRLSQEPRELIPSPSSELDPYPRHIESLAAIAPCLHVQPCTNVLD